MKVDRGELKHQTMTLGSRGKDGSGYHEDVDTCDTTD